MKYHTSLLDTDLYKLTMQMAICSLYPKVEAQYTFINRDKRPFPPGFGVELRRIVDSFAGYQLTTEEHDFLKEKCYYLNPVYLDFLRGYRYNPAEVFIDQKDDVLSVEVHGFWYKAVLWEVPLMETISELYFEMTSQKGAEHDIRRMNNAVKARDLAETGIYYSEFGSRRRFSFENQDMVIEDLRIHGSDHMVGTSNIALALRHNLTPMGTMAHEWIQGHAAMFGYLQANEKALEAWVNVYQGDLGIALPDTFTSSVFYRHAFTTKYAKLFDGVRQDSGDPKEFIAKTVQHYTRLRIPTKTKTILFSDNLKSIEQIKELHNACDFQMINDRYGIGTWLSNDVLVKPLNIVIKMTALNFGQGAVPTVKLSDSPTKHTGDSEAVDLCLKTLKIQ